MNSQLTIQKIEVFAPPKNAGTSKPIDVIAYHHANELGELGNTYLFERCKMKAFL